MFVANHKAYHSEDVYVHGQKYSPKPKNNFTLKKPTA
jgi:hypothetical protein